MGYYDAPEESEPTDGQIILEAIREGHIDKEILENIREVTDIDLTCLDPSDMFVGGYGIFDKEGNLTRFGHAIQKALAEEDAVASQEYDKWAEEMAREYAQEADE